MTTIAVKPHPDLPPAGAKVLVHPASGGLLDAGGKVPDDGRPWLNDGFTARMLTDGAILRADDPLFAALAAAAEKAKAEDEVAEDPAAVAAAARDFSAVTYGDVHLEAAEKSVDPAPGADPAH